MKETFCLEKKEVISQLSSEDALSAPHKRKKKLSHGSTHGISLAQFPLLVLAVG